eukprot:GGOE01040920.1.p1 GENE.GGOE01040920.1~~GGOE01040920.1.p1  ORF type:complete len:409 (-),score=79.48 GGOE01040920.1:207-1385(-)
MAGDLPFPLAHLAEGFISEIHEANEYGRINFVPERTNTFIIDGQVQEYVDLTDGFENNADAREPFVYAKLPIPLYNKVIKYVQESRASGLPSFRSRPYVIKGCWTDDEDRKLVELVAHFGTKDWKTISTQMVGRNAKQCRERYVNHLDPTLCKEKWTPMEDQIIFDAHKKHGNQWSKIAALMPNKRTANATKNHWNSTLRRLERQRSHLADDTQPLCLPFPTLAQIAEMSHFSNTYDDETGSEAEEEEDGASSDGARGQPLAAGPIPGAEVSTSSSSLLAGGLHAAPPAMPTSTMGFPMGLMSPMATSMDMAMSLGFKDEERESVPQPAFQFLPSGATAWFPSHGMPVPTMAFPCTPPPSVTPSGFAHGQGTATDFSHMLPLLQTQAMPPPL